MKHWLILSVAGLLALSLIGCASPAQLVTTPPASASPIVSATSTPAELRPLSVKLKPCTIGSTAALCGTYRVYENRSARSGRRIDLNIAVLPATGNHVEPDPLFYFAGGPGGAAIDNLPFLASELHELNQTRDIVLVDQRGTGGSHKLACPEIAEPIAFGDAAVLPAYIADCLKTLDADLRWYTTRAYVDDVDEVRQALGYNQINISGASYGGTVAQIYLQQHPETVRTATLLVSSQLDYPIFEHFPDSSQRALELVFERCARDERCQAAFPELQAEFDAAFAQLAKQPVATSVRASATGRPISVTTAILASAVHALLMDASSAAQLPRLIHHAAVHGDWNAIATIYLKDVLQLQGQLARLPMLHMIICAEPWAVNRPGAVTANGQASYYTTAWLAVAQTFVETCPLLPQPEPAALYGPLRPSKVPVLVLNAAEDPQDPAANVARLSEMYPNSRVLFQPYRAHNSADWSCTTPVITEFVKLGSINDLTAKCLNKVQPYAFDVRP